MDLSACRHILVFGGSFDPPHQAHVDLPHQVMRCIGADIILYVPAACPPHKTRVLQASAEHRLAMLQLALEDHPHASVHTDELDRAKKTPDQPSYTVHTLQRLRQTLGPDVTMRWLIGGDMLRIFHTWYQYRRIIELAQPLVMLRPPDTHQSLLDALPPNEDRAVWQQRLVEVKTSNLSSANIRQQLAAGKSAVPGLDEKVLQYIQRFGLYQAV